MQEGKLRNPITSEEVDEIIKEKEARERGYLDFQFMLKYLEDESEFIKYFIIEGKKIVVDIARPNLEYKKKTNLDYERILQTTAKKEDNILPLISNIVSCDVDNQTPCISCSG